MVSVLRGPEVNRYRSIHQGQSVGADGDGNGSEDLVNISTVLDIGVAG